MIRLIEQAFSADIQALSFIERYGGLARPTELYVPAGNVTLLKVFPVSCDISEQDCFEVGKYNQLVPNDAYNSVSWFEQNGDGPVVIGGPKAGHAISTQNMRFVCWLNLKRLGYNDCKGTTRFELAVLKALTGSRSFTVDGITGRIDVSSTSVIQQDRARIFGKYSFAESRNDAIFFWPFGFFAVDLTCKVSVSLACLDELEAESAIECITNW